MQRPKAGKTWQAVETDRPLWLDHSGQSERVGRDEVDRSWFMCGVVNLKKDCGFYSKCEGNPIDLCHLIL